MKKLFFAAFFLTVAACYAMAQETDLEFGGERGANFLKKNENASWFAKHVFMGIKFGVFSDWKEGGNNNFSYVIRPSVGYYINDRWAVGLKLNFIDSRLVQSGESSVSLFDNINYTIAGLLMGKGLSNNFMSWEIKEFVRYRATKLIWDKLNLWIELNTYQGMRYPRLEDGKLDTPGRKITYGAALYPAITYNITDKWMLYTSFEMLSLYYDGASRVTQDLAGAKDQMERHGTFTFQANPLYAIAKSIVNISIIKSF